MHAEDDFGNAPAVLLTDDKTEIQRPKPNRGRPGKPVQRFYLALTLAPTFAGGALTDLTPVVDSVSELFIRQMNAKDRKAVTQRLNLVVQRLRTALQHALKHA